MHEHLVCCLEVKFLHAHLLFDDLALRSAHRLTHLRIQREGAFQPYEPFLCFAQRHEAVSPHVQGPCIFRVEL